MLLAEAPAPSLERVVEPLAPPLVDAEGQAVREWDNAETRPLPLSAVGERYRRYRLADLSADEAMVAAAVRPVVAGDGVLAGWPARGGRWLQAEDGGETDLLANFERAPTVNRRALGEGGDSRSQQHRRLAEQTEGSLDRAGLRAGRRPVSGRGRLAAQ